MTQPTTGQLIEDAPTSGATISVCGTYRFHLWRVLPLPPIDHVLGRVDAPRVAGRGRVLFVMNNPSTADAEEHDPTIRRCIGFAAAWGFDRVDVERGEARASERLF